jgi:hypothetical protein
MQHSDKNQEAAKQFLSTAGSSEKRNLVLALVESFSSCTLVVSDARQRGARDKKMPQQIAAAGE